MDEPDARGKTQPLAPQDAGSAQSGILVGRAHWSAPMLLPRLASGCQDAHSLFAVEACPDAGRAAIKFVQF